MSYVIRLPDAVPNGQCWYDGSDVISGKLGIVKCIIRAAEYMSYDVAKSSKDRLMRMFPDHTFVIDPALPEGMNGTVFGDNYWIV